MTLTGSGYFAFWFLIGWLAYVAVRKILRRNQTWEIWGSFMPYALGFYGAFPYALWWVGLVSEESLKLPIMNVFLFYPMIPSLPGVELVFGSLHKAVAVSAMVYLLIIANYLRMLCRPRRWYAE